MELQWGVAGGSLYCHAWLYTPDYLSDSIFLSTMHHTPIKYKKLVPVLYWVHTLFVTANIYTAGES